MVSNDKGFTLFEILLVVAIGGIIALSATLSYLKHLPDHRLKNAANQLYMDLIDAQSLAVNDLTSVTVTFNQAANSYTITNLANGSVIKSVNLSSFQSGVCYGSGPATETANNAHSPFEGNFTRYFTPDDTTTFNPDGTVSNTGYVYLTNINQNICYAIATPYVAGMIKILKTGSEKW